MSILFGAAACAPSAVDDPTWARDVAPILAANCVRCHGVPASGGAPSTFRLDSYEDWTADDGTVIQGARTMVGRIAGRAASEAAPMPPDATMYDHHIDTLVAWDGERGEPREDNELPEVRALTPLDQTQVQGDVLTIRYEILDADNDIVLGELRATSGAGDLVVTRELHSGRGEVRWNLADVPAGTYNLEARLDDTNGVQSFPVGTFQVSGNAAP